MIIIRDASLADLSGLAVLFDEYRVFYKKDPAPEEAADFLRARIENRESVIFVAADDGGRLWGFVQLYPLFSSTRMRRLWLLNDLYVHPGARGRGISVLLIDKAKAHCRLTNACGLTLETAKTNTIGNGLYPKTGFVLDEDHNYYSWDVE
jgi:ribosomal protein S18 acetylase RimI-like enzyme